MTPALPATVTTMEAATAAPSCDGFYFNMNGWVPYLSGSRAVAFGVESRRISILVRWR